MKQIQGGVTAAKGFEAAGVEAAIKYQNRKDMALIVSKVPCTVAGTFTSNVVKAAPVLWDKQIVEHSAYAQAVVVNSGIANACTGRQGLDCCEAEAKCAGELLGVPTDAVLVASTGVIGMQIPVDKITAGIEKLVAAKADTLEAGSDAAHAIMTTATISKEIHDYVVTCVSVTKTFNLAGLQASTTIFPNLRMKADFDRYWSSMDIHRNNAFSSVAIEAAYREGREWLDQLLPYLSANFDFVKEYCEKNIPQIKPNIPDATYLVWLDCRDLGMSNEELRKFMIEKAKIGLNEGYTFGRSLTGFMRLNVACPRSVLEKALGQLKEAVDALDK